MQKKPVKGERDGVEIESSSECALSKRRYVVVASIDVAIHIWYVMTSTVFGMLCLYWVCYFHIWYVISTTVGRFSPRWPLKKIDLISLEKNRTPLAFRDFRDLDSRPIITCLSS